MLGYAIRRTEDRAAAEDAVSETFLVAWRRLDAVPPDPLPWLLGTARKVLANQRRAARRRTPDGPLIPLEAVPDPALGASLPDLVADREAFADAFAALSAADRELLTLVSWDGLAPREGAAVLGISAAVFSLRLHRARRRLMKGLASRGHSLARRDPEGRAEAREGSKDAR